MLSFEGRAWMKRLTTRTIGMLRKMTFALILSVCIMGLYAQSLKADEPAKSADGTLDGKTAKKGKMSLAEAEPLRARRERNQS
jgi:hypothetical protein